MRATHALVADRTKWRPHSDTCSCGEDEILVARFKEDVLLRVLVPGVTNSQVYHDAIVEYSGRSEYTEAVFLKIPGYETFKTAMYNASNKSRPPGITLETISTVFIPREYSMYRGNSIILGRETFLQACDGRLGDIIR